MKSIELFAGAGGLGMGLHKAGFDPLQVVEWDRDSCETLRENQVRGQPLVSNWPLREVDVRSVDFTGFSGRVDLVSGGPPCQPFSLGGKHRADSDARDMFPQAIRAVRESQPRAFLFENVKGLTRVAFRNYFEYIRLQLEHPDLTVRKEETWQEHLTRLEKHHTYGRRDGLHYQVVVRVLNAANYGVPQRRERVVFVGFRDDLHVSWCFPGESHSLEALLWDQVRGDYWDRHCISRKFRTISERSLARGNALREKPIGSPWVTVRDAIRDLPDPERAFTTSSIANHRFQGGARTYTGHTGSPFDEPAKTLKAGVHGVPGGENMLARADGSVRYFTIRECARLQTFPDDYQFHGSWTESMRQLGNAVPVKLAHVVGEDVAMHLRLAA